MLSLLRPDRHGHQRFCVRWQSQPGPCRFPEADKGIEQGIPDGKRHPGTMINDANLKLLGERPNIDLDSGLRLGGCFKRIQHEIKEGMFDFLWTNIPAISPDMRHEFARDLISERARTASTAWRIV